MTETAPTAEPVFVAPPGRRAVKAWDIVLSIVLAILGLIGWIVGVGLSLVATTFEAGDCNDPTCDPANSQPLQLTAITAPSVLVLGILIAVVRLILRRVAWPFALAGGLLCASAQVAGVLLFNP